MIELRGEWVHHPTKGYRDWRGRIVAPHEWLAVTLLRVGDRVSWVKSTAMDSVEKHDVRLLISPPEQAIGTAISYGIAGAVARYNLSAMDPGILSLFPATTELRAGEIFWLATAPGAVDLGLGGIIIRRDDTDRLRKGLWRIRGATSGLSSVLRDMLAYGRVGVVPLTILAEELPGDDVPVPAN